MWTTSLVLLFALTSSLEAGQLSSCVEEDVCQSIIFNQLAIAALNDGVKEVLLSLNKTRNPHDFVPKGELDTCFSQKNNLLKQIASLPNQVVQMDEGRDRQLEELSKSVETLNRSNENLMRSKENLETSVETFRTSLEDSRRSNENLMRSKENLETSVETFRTSLEDSRRSNENLTRSNENLETTIETLRRTLEDCRRSNENLTRSKENLERENRRLQPVIVEKDDRITNLTTPFSSKPVDCADIQVQGNTESGVYTLYPYGPEKSIEALCDLESNGGGWTVFFTRQPQDEPLDFNESWENFKNGFGNLNTEHWLGNEFIHVLTSHGTSTLRLDAEIYSGERRWIEWNTFAVGDEASKYQMTLEDYEVTSTMGDSFGQNGNSSFTTFDSDNDQLKDLNCAMGTTYGYWGKGGWWYKGCGATRPTAPLKNSNAWNSACWQKWNTEGYSLVSFKSLSMKFRRHNYEELAELS